MFVTNIRKIKKTVDFIGVILWEHERRIFCRVLVGCL